MEYSNIDGYLHIHVSIYVFVYFCILVRTTTGLSLSHCRHRHTLSGNDCIIVVRTGGAGNASTPPVALQPSVCYRNKLFIRLCN